MFALQKETFEYFAKASSTLSWSKFKNFKDCSMSYFIQNFAKGDPDGEVLVVDHMSALPGLVIQRILEGYINGRLYKDWPIERAGFRDWIWNNVDFLFELLVVPLDFQREYPNSQYYFNSFQGKKRVAKVQQDYGLENFDVFFRDPSLIYIDQDSERFFKRYKSRASVVDMLTDRIVNVLKSFVAYDMNFDTVLSEIPFKSVFEDGKLSGRIDFIANLQGVGIFEDISQIQDGYILFDGKNSMKSAFDMDQVMFYTIGIFNLYGVKPSWIGYWNWETATPYLYKYSNQWYSTVYQDVWKVMQMIQMVKETMQNMPGNYDNLVDLRQPLLPLSFTPSEKSCRFCKLNREELCQVAWRK